MIQNTYPKRLQLVQRHGLEVPEAAVAKVRRLYAELGPSMEPMQLASDIWALGRRLSGHRDSTADGKVTYGVILIADGYGPNIHYGTGNYRHAYAIEPGSIYAIDGREYHGVDYQCGDRGLLAFLAWDLPYDFTLQGFARRALKRLRSWGGAEHSYLQPGAGI